MAYRTRPRNPHQHISGFDQYQRDVEFGRSHELAVAERAKAPALAPRTAAEQAEMDRRLESSKVLLERRYALIEENPRMSWKRSLKLATEQLLAEGLI